jgi:hypothetical protein
MCNLKILFPMLLILGACTTTIPRRNPVGEFFPDTVGTALDGKVWKFPNDTNGENVLLLIGYKQNTQFDIDRWLIGLDQKGYKISVFEVPTIQGWVPRVIAGKIDEGMRSGIPEDLWKIVVTVYDDAEKIINFTGNEDSSNARVVVLDKDGKVRLLHDRGFSVNALNSLSQYFQKGKPTDCP